MTGRVAGTADARDAAHVAVVLALGWFVYLRNLDGYALRRWDEAIYGSAAQMMVREGHWLVPRVRGFHALQPRVFLEKPPLVMWLQAAGVAALGPTELAVRLPSALAAVALGVVVYLFARDLTDRNAAVVAAVFLLVTPGLYGTNNAGRLGGMETPLLLFGTLFVWFTWRATVRDARWFLPAGVAAGLAVLTKGFAAGPFALAVLPLFAASPRTVLQERVAVAKAVAAAALVALPWYLAVYLLEGSAFVYQIYEEQVLRRAAGEMYTYTVGVPFEFMEFPYFRYLFDGFDPWSYFLFPAFGALLWAAHADRDRERRRDVLFLGWWAASTFLLFLPTGNHAWYLLPAFVPGAVLVGWTVARATRGARPDAAAVLVGALAAALLSFRATGGPDFRVVVSPAAVSGAEFRALLLGGALLVAATSALANRGGPGERASVRDRVRMPPWSGRAVALAVLLVFAVATVGAPPALPWGNEEKMRDLGVAATERTVPGETVYLTEDVGEKQVTTLLFYVDRPVAVGGLEDAPAGRFALVGRTPPSRPHRALVQMTLTHGGPDLRVDLVRLQ